MAIASDDAAEEAHLRRLERTDRAHRQPVRQPATQPVTQPQPAVPAQPPGTAAKPAKPKSAKPKPAKPKPKRTTAPTRAKQPETAVRPPSGAAGTVIAFALAQVGKPYSYGASGPNAFDCSGLVAASYARVGIRLPHQSESIAGRGRRVPAGQWQPGDVIHTPGHVAIYLGGGRQVEATRPGTGIRVGPVRGGTAYRFL